MLPKLRVILSFWFIFWLFFSCATFGIVKGQRFDESRLENMVESADGTLTSVSSNNGGEKLIFTYNFSFTYDGATYKDTSYGYEYLGYKENDTVKIKFDPDHPDVAAIVGTELSNTPLSEWKVIATVNFLFFGVMIFLAYRRLNTLQNGKMGTAQIDNKTGQLEYEYEGQGYTKSPGFKWRYRGFKSIPIIINEKKPNIAYPLFKIGLIYDDEHAKWFATTWSVAVRLVFVAFCLLFLLV